MDRARSVNVHTSDDNSKSRVEIIVSTDEFGFDPTLKI